MGADAVPLVRTYTCRDFERTKAMKDSVANVRFTCQTTRCDCEIVLKARVSRREDGKPMYEYDNVAASCPKCGHRLFGQHRARDEDTIH